MLHNSGSIVMFSSINQVTEKNISFFMKQSSGKYVNKIWVSLMDSLSGEVEMGKCCFCCLADSWSSIIFYRLVGWIQGKGNLWHVYHKQQVVRISDYEERIEVNLLKNYPFFIDGVFSIDNTLICYQKKVPG